MDSKLIVLDVDGTLLTSDRRILRSTRRVLSSAIEEGHQIILASGRYPGGILPLMEDLSLENSLYIALSGALVGRGEEVLHEETCPQKPLEAAVAQAREQKLSVNVYTGMRWEVMDWRDEVAQEAAIIGAQPTLVSNLTLKGANKVMIIAPPDQAEAFEAWTRQNVSGLHCAAIAPNLVDLLKEGVNKGAALTWAANFLDIPLQDCIVLGDGVNDVELMEIAGISIAMGNANEAVKSHADFVTSTNDQGGVAWALAQVLRLRQVGAKTQSSEKESHSGSRREPRREPRTEPE